MNEQIILWVELVSLGVSGRSARTIHPGGLQCLEEVTPSLDEKKFSHKH